MPISLLTTKLNIPPVRAGLVSRPRLLQKMREDLNCNLMLVSAPAGFGKTTLLNEWCRAAEAHPRTAWLSLDDGDNDPVRFWDYFIAALRKLHSAMGETSLALLHSPQPVPIQSLLVSLINEIALIPVEFVMVLDDYHLINSQPIHDGITYLIEHLPARMRLVIATRADPPLPLARFRGRGIMQEIRTEDLRFNLEETRALLETLRTPGLSADNLQALNEKTEGWAVGLKMATLSLAHQDDISGFVAGFTGSQRYIMDYLLEEVLRPQTKQIQDFLLQTSILERFSAPLCETVTGLSDGRELLHYLERSHLFLVPLDETRDWYRYEHLFADLLVHRLNLEAGPERVAELHRRAGQWFENQGAAEEAVNHAAAARDWGRYIRIMLDLSKKLRVSGEFKTLLRLFSLIPEDLLRENPGLYNQYAATLSAVGQLDAAESALKYLEASTRADPGLQAEVAFSLATVARYRGDMKGFIDCSEKALRLAPVSDIGMRCKATFNLGAGLFEANLFRDLETRLNEATALAVQAGETWFAAAGLNYLGARLHQKGELGKAIEVYKKAVKISGNSSVGMNPLTKLCRVFYEQNDLQAAGEYLQQALIRAQSSGIMDGAPIGPFFLCLLDLAKGDSARIPAILDQMDKICQHPTVTPSYRAAALAARILLALRLNDLETATFWGKKLDEYGGSQQLEFRYVPAVLLIARGRREEAARMLEDLHRKMVEYEASGLAIGVRLCQALAADDDASALDFLADSLKNGESKGYVRTFVDQGRLLRPLLEKALSKGITPEYTRKLLDIIRTEERLRQKASGKIILSERELEILLLLEAEVSNQEIADRLIISLSTVKTHLHHIFEKLNAKDRSQAIYLARELKLL